MVIIEIQDLFISKTFSGMDSRGPSTERLTIKMPLILKHN